MSVGEDDFGLAVEVPVDFEAAVSGARIALRAGGFGILSEMPAPSGPAGEARRHLFMGVWERQIDSSNLGGVGLDLGDHLAVNVVVYEEEGSTIVAALDPSEGLGGWESASAQQARSAITDVLNRLASGV